MYKTLANIFQIICYMIMEENVISNHKKIKYQI